MIRLSRPIVFYDLETTGLDPMEDRIISIAMIKIETDGNREIRETLINPEKTISNQITVLTGISDLDVANKPKFRQVSKAMYEFLKGCDIAGFNNNSFDNIFLNEEFGRCGIDYPEKNTKSIDVCQIFRLMERRDLFNAIKFYCNKEIDQSLLHGARQDTEFTIEVFLGMLEKYEDFSKKDVDYLHEFCKGENNNTVDLVGKIARNDDGDYIYTFGKHKDKKIKDHLDYADWMLADNFPSNTKMHLRDIVKEIKKTDSDIII